VTAMKSTPKPPAKQPATARTYFQERAARSIPGEAKRILEKAGRGNPPMPGDTMEDLELGMVGEVSS
jgi:hypothetical protein